MENVDIKNLNLRLLTAVQNGETSEILEVLGLGAEISCRKEKDSATVLHIACISGRHRTVELLLS